MNTIYFQSIDFNPSPPTIMHLDLNSCFAAVEQQANPLLRGKPVAVAAYTSSNGCILAASVEAKRFGVKTGMRVGDGQKLCSSLIILPSDPEKYRFVNHRLQILLGEYSSCLSVESIDEMVLQLAHSPKLSRMTIIDIAKEIKKRLKTEIGDWLTVSVGIAPNRYLAKVASSLHKPDGLDIINRENIEKVLATLTLTDLCGIKEGISSRLCAAGIDTPVKLYQADVNTLVSVLHSIAGYHWYLRFHGFEDGSLYKNFDELEDPLTDSGQRQKTFGQSYAFGKSFTPVENGLYQVLWQLVAKMGRRLRQDGAEAAGIFVSCLFVDHTRWGQGKKMNVFLSSDFDFYQRLKILLAAAPHKPVRILAISCFHLNYLGKQESLFEEDRKKVHLMHTIDAIHDRWGDGLITSGRVLGTAQPVIDRIAFGRIRKL